MLPTVVDSPRSSGSDPGSPAGPRARGAVVKYGVAALALTVVMAVTLLAMGRVPICTCGYVKLWHGVVFSSENSQHVSDWYTFTHILHGFAFYGLAWLAGRHWPLGLRFVLAVLAEGAWEVVENTNMVIERYREVTISLDYYGDSVLNSVSDLGAMALGFWAASRVTLPTIVAAAVALEVFLAWAIRDNLTLNILMLLYPLDVVREWQGG